MKERLPHHDPIQQRVETDAIIKQMQKHPNDHVRELWSRNDPGIDIMAKTIAGVMRASTREELKAFVDGNVAAYKQSSNPREAKALKGEIDTDALDRYYTKQEEFYIPGTMSEHNREEEVAVARDIKHRLDTLLDPQNIEINSLHHLRKQTAVLTAQLQLAVEGQPSNALQDLRTRMRLLEDMTRITYDTVRVKPPEKREKPAPKPRPEVIQHDIDITMENIDEVLKVQTPIFEAPKQKANRPTLSFRSVDDIIGKIDEL